ncbi:MAG: hypothetical protein ACMVY4_12265 [Minwuia sp.]|uniref:hypothetical protein n=1 Tax=Minwuia sp. TaxID=2493630 RepID=UPI003A868D3F
MQTNINRRTALTGVAALATIIGGAFHPRASKAADDKLESLWHQWVETREAAIEADHQADTIEGEMKRAASRKLPPSSLEVPAEYEWYRTRPAYLFDAVTDPNSLLYQGETLRAFRDAQAKEIRAEGDFIRAQMKADSRQAELQAAKARKEDLHSRADSLRATILDTPANTYRGIRIKMAAQLHDTDIDGFADDDGDHMRDAIDSDLRRLLS